MEHFLAAPLYIQIHATFALYALIVGPLAIYRKRRDILHKTIGYSWIISMVIVAISSFWISSFGVIGPFSPIHLLSFWTLFVVFRAINFARIGKIVAHAEMLRWLYWGGLWVAFALNFLPGRMSNRIVFGRDEAEVMAIVAILLVAGTFLIASRWRGIQRRLSLG
ncbi:MAG: DUF2306 domain-containing protein [Paracoccaceae bacterium]|nr:DUF2306 domain-containing protein [Paracoccaceae bacterium]MDG1737416.1 DUF2306 domain-containing protein [Paracoccaceae bacterium]